MFQGNLLPVSLLVLLGCCSGGNTFVTPPTTPIPTSATRLRLPKRIIPAGPPEKVTTEYSTNNICLNPECKDPCNNVCGDNTDCEIINNSPMCSCKQGFIGHPFTGCVPAEKPECTTNSECSADEACLNSKCIDACLGACGVNTDCKVMDHRPVCACSRGFHWNSSSGCLPVSSPDCTSDALCAPNLACRRQHCVDPCDGVCGNNTVCQVTDHHPACACAPGFSGNPFEDCKPLCSSALETTVYGTLSNPDSELMDQETTRLQKKLHLHTELLNFIEAFDYCASQNMSLLSISSEREQEHVEAFMFAKRLDLGVWTSAFHLRKYFWITTEKSLEYTNWLDKDVIEANDDCVFVSAVTSPGLWIREICTRKLKVICQYSTL